MCNRAKNIQPITVLNQNYICEVADWKKGMLANISITAFYLPVYLKPY
jgi:hypothetical protein